MDFPESDWRRFKDVRAKLLEKYCTRVLEELAAVSGGQGSAHERYLKAYEIIHKRDKELANAFNDFRRSTAINQLIIMRRMKLLTDEHLSLFSEQTRTTVEAISAL